METANRTDDLKPAVFLDRDGTLIEDVGVLDRFEKIHLFSDTVAALKQLQKKYLLFVITNQSAVAEGLLSLDRVTLVNRYLDNMLRREAVYIQEWYVCPHSRKDNCSCIKPKPEFVLRARNKYHLDLKRSFVIGDHPHDVFTAHEHGVFGLYLLTGHGGKHLPELGNDQLVFHRISDAAGWIMDHPDPEAALERQIADGAESIRNGGVAAFPTETVYGLGADVFQPDAVEKIFRIKGRPHYNPLIAHISDMEQLHRLVTDIPQQALNLVEKLWPGPLTIVLPKRKEVPDIVTGGNDTVAVRMPAHPIARELIRLCGTPIAAPSANAFTCTSPTTARHVRDQLGDKCDVVIDGGACRVGVESTVISFTGPVPVILRPGGIPVEDIEELIGKVQTPAISPDAGAADAVTLNNTDHIQSPGMMSNHYAPATKLSVFTEIPGDYADKSDIGVLLFRPSARQFEGPVEILSNYGDTKEAAANFFAALRRLDALGLQEIVAEYSPDYGLGNAVNNRLSKAAMGRSTE